MTTTDGDNTLWVNVHWVFFFSCPASSRPYETSGQVLCLTSNAQKEAGANGAQQISVKGLFGHRHDHNCSADARQRGSCFCFFSFCFCGAKIFNAGQVLYYRAVLASPGLGGSGRHRWLPSLGILIRKSYLNPIPPNSDHINKPWSSPLYTYVATGKPR